MPVTMQDVEGKLDEHSISELDEAVREKVYGILKAIIDECDRQGFAKTSQLTNPWFLSRFSTIRIGDRYARGIQNYLGQLGYVRIGEEVPARGAKKGRRPKKIEVTEEGRGAFRFLDDLLSPPKKNTVSLGFSSGGKDYKVELFIGAENLSSDIERISILFTPEVLERLRETVLSLISSTLQGNFALTIGGNLPSIVKSPIITMIWHMATYFDRAKRIALNEAASLRPQDYKDRYGLLLPKDLSDRILYGRYFESKLEPVMNLFNDWGANDIVSHLDLPKSFVSLLKKREVRNWIVKRLDEDPNFFMPNFCWVKLGFPGSGKPCEEIKATPPSFDKLFSYPSFEAKIILLAEHLETAMAKMGYGLYDRVSQRKARRLRAKIEKENGGEWSGKKDAYDGLRLAMLNVDLDPEFYECWRVVRNVSRYKSAVSCGDFYRIFDSAYEKYILNDRKPAVDLAKVFADLADNKCDLSGAIEQIRKGHYQIEPGKKDRYDPLERREKRLRDDP